MSERPASDSEPATPGSPSFSAGRVLGATLVVAGGFAASKVLGLLRNVVIGYQYGASREYEMFLAALTVPDTLFQVLAGGAVGSAFIPVFSAYLARGDRDGAWRLTSSLATLGFLALAGGAAIVGFFAPWIVALLVPGWPADEQARTANLVRIMLVSPALFALSTLATSTLNAMNRFALAALAPLTYNLSICYGAIFLRPLGVEGLALSAVAGALLHLLVQLPGLAVVRMRYTPTLGLRVRETREVIRLMGPRIIGLGVTQLNQLVTIALASFLIEGSIAYLNYAWLVLMVPLGVAAMGTATAVFPELSRQVAADRLDSARRTFHLGLGVVVVTAMLGAIGLIVLNRRLVAVLLERGEFGPEAAAATAFALSWYAVGLPGHAAIEMLSRGFYAVRDTATPVRIAALGGAVNVLLSLILMRTPLSYGGLALANGLAALTEATVLGITLRRRLGWPGSTEIARFIGPALLAAGAFAVGCLAGEYGLASYLDSSQWPGQLASVLLSSTLGTLAAGAALLLVARQQTLWVTRMLRGTGSWA